MSKKTGFMWHERFMWFRQGEYSGILPAEFPLEPGAHFESAGTKRRLKNLLDVTGMTNRLVPIEARAASDEELGMVHTRRYLDTLAGMNAVAGGDAGLDAPFLKGGFDIARLAVGGCIEAADAIMAGKVDNAYCLVRPVGHHVEPEKGMGFGILSNAGVAGMHLLNKHGIKRIAYIDLDVHHGNGAETIFWRDPRALTISVHQENWFPPDRGAASANGEGEGSGFNINVPLPAGSGWGAYQDAMNRVVLPALERFKPEFVIAPTGYDAGAQDPLGRMILGSSHYRIMMRSLMDIADKYAKGRLLVTHEGGYNESTAPFFGMAVIETLSGESSGVEDPYGFIFDHMQGHELLPHQRDAVSVAEKLVERVTSEK